MKESPLRLVAVEAKFGHGSPTGWAIKAAQLLSGGRKHYRIIHVGLACREGDHWTVIEALERAGPNRRGGVIRSPLAVSLGRYAADGDYHVWFVPLKIDAPKTGTFWREAEAMVGRPYDVAGAIRSVGLLEWLVGPGLEDDRALFCSEAIAIAAVRGPGHAMYASTWAAWYGFNQAETALQTPARVAGWPVWDWKAEVPIV